MRLIGRPCGNRIQERGPALASLTHLHQFWILPLMNRFTKLTSIVLFVVSTTPLAAQQQSTLSVLTEHDRSILAENDQRSGSRYYPSEPTEEVKRPSLARLKSQARAEQRMARIEAQRWYGVSKSRPTVASTPFTSIYYGPAWSRGRRRLAWRNQSRPVVIIDQPGRLYR